MINFSTRRLGAVGLLGTAVLALTAAPAFAHVTVRADSVTGGSFSGITFRVPNESDTAGTTKLVVTLPSDQPLLYVSTKPVPGWTASTTEAKLAKPVQSYGTTITQAVRTVTWTADGSTQIKPGQYQEFSISAGPLPASGPLVLPATQTYSDGTVVKWDQVVAAGAEEPEHPAPQIVVQPSSTAESSATPSAAPATAAPVAVSAAVDPVSRLLSGLALVVGVVAIVLTVLNQRSSARP